MSQALVPDEDRLPADWWQKAASVALLIKEFRLHIVGLFIRGRAGTEHRSRIYTGFLLHHNERALWITAGHVIERLSDAITSPNFDVDEIHWVDTYPDQHLTAAPAFFHHTKYMMKSWRDGGPDLGALVLTALDQDSLAGNKNIRIFEITQRPQTLSSTNKYEGRYVVGFPEELIERTTTNPSETIKLHKVTPNLACLPIRPVAPPAGHMRDPFWDHPGMFYGEVLPYIDLPEAKLPDILGMSGGPILAIWQNDNNQFQYDLVGVQSTWLEPEQSIRAVPIDTALELLDAWNKPRHT